MAVDTRPTFVVRGTAVPSYSDGAQAQGAVNRRGELLVGQALPPLANLVAQKNSWYAKTATAAAPVTAIPTTAYKIAIWNGDSTKVYVMDSAFFTVVADTAAIQELSMLGNVSVQPITTAIANTITPKPLYAGATYGGQARVEVATTTDATNGVAANWQTLGTTTGSASLSVGCGMDVDLKGMIIIPYQHQFALTVISGAATATSVQLGFRWHEITLPLP